MIDKIPSNIYLNTSRCVISNLTFSDIEDVIPIYTDEITRKYLGGALDKEKAKEKVELLLENLGNLLVKRMKNILN